MEEAPVSADAPRFAPLGAREERTADWLHKRSPRASALLIGVVMALLSLGVCALMYWLTGIRAEDARTATAMYALPFMIPMTFAPMVFVRILRMSKALFDRTDELQSEVERRKAAERQLEILASVDDLTRVANRRAFFIHVSTLADDGRPACVAVIDLDNFKALNDTLGHAAGDDALREFGAILRATVARDAIIGRLGGEEFGVVMPDHDCDGARVSMDRLRETLVASRVQVTASIGVTDWSPATDDSIDAALARADVALYRAKQHGRNRVEVVARNDDAVGTSDLAPLARRGDHDVQAEPPSDR
ncbi:MAG TPA: GGDEF domain-containing protein [Miltoncostaeales bacterium]|jgi:diguanylate cyclase (GGDEF)-like protein|nr:GGDEF domain-containing protein [Miltoncostaeales bacterium]